MSEYRIASLAVDRLGKIYVAASASGIVGISFRCNFESLKHREGTALVRVRESEFAPLRKQLSKYAKGRRVEFEQTLDIKGTPFQKRVWKAIASIPWGQTRSYKWLAAKAGRPKAVRAAANACGANPLPIVIPCHRVIASNGSIGGFSGGLALKRKLLGIEGIEIGG